MTGVKKGYTADELLQYAHKYNQIPVMLFAKDTEGRYVFATETCGLVNAGSEKSIIGKTDYEIQFDKKLGMRYYKEDMDIIKNGISTHTINSVLSDGVSHYLEITKNPIFNDAKEVIGICGICNDITELVNMKKKYELLSLYDNLTGLYNRNYTVKFDFDNEGSLPCSYIICDCNNLKKINDEYGHIEGDRCLREIADRLKSIVSDNSVVIRWGGDEFLIITPSCSEEEHEDLIESVKDWHNDFAADSRKIKLAVGGALRTSLDVHESDILKAADDKMYADKKQYKERFCKIS